MFLVVFVVTNVSAECFFATVARSAQYLAAWNVAQSVDGCERSARTMRRYQLVPVFCFAGDNAVNLVIDVYFVQKIFANMVQKFVQITVVIINFACIWCVVAVFLQYCKSNTAVDAHGVYWHMAFVSSFLLYYAKDAITEVLRADAYQIRITLPQVTTQYKHIAHLFKRLNFIFA